MTRLERGLDAPGHRPPFLAGRLTPALVLALALALATVCLLAGCASDPAKDGTASSAARPGSARTSAARPSTGNAELDRLLAIEAKGFASSPQAMPDHLPYRGSLPQAYTFTAEEGVDRFDMLLDDPGGVISCYVFPEEVELGVTAARIAKIGRDAIPSEPPVTSLRIDVPIGGTEGPHAYHGVAWLLGNAKGFAQPKAVAGNAAGHGVACLHLGLGYRETVIDSLLHVMGSLERKAPLPEPYFEEIMLTEIDGMLVGVSRVRMYLDAEGDTEIRSESSTVFPTAPDAIDAGYSFTRSWSRPDGSLINAHAGDSDMESHHTDLALRFSEDQWRVEGTFQGKPIDQVLAHRGAIDSTLGEYRSLVHGLKPGGEATQVDLVEWEPDADPTRVVEVRFVLDPADPTRLTATLGPLRVDAERGRDGLIDLGTFPVADRTMKMSVSYRAGGI